MFKNITKLKVFEVIGILMTAIGGIITAVISGKKNEKTLERLVNEKMANKQ